MQYTRTLDVADSTESDGYVAIVCEAAEKLRLSEAQAKKLDKKLRLAFFPLSPVS
jgi:hypothetical protein